MAPHLEVLACLSHVLDSEMFADVTICCQKQRLQAHRILLSACSPYLQRLLLHHPTDDHVTLILDGVHHDDMAAILVFVYTGQVSVSKHRVNLFLKAAELLDIEILIPGREGGATNLSLEEREVPVPEGRTTGTGTSSGRRDSNRMNWGEDGGETYRMKCMSEEEEFKYKLMKLEIEAERYLKSCTNLPREYFVRNIEKAREFVEEKIAKYEEEAKLKFEELERRHIENQKARKSEDGLSVVDDGECDVNVSAILNNLPGMSISKVHIEGDALTRRARRQSVSLAAERSATGGGNGRPRGLARVKPLPSLMPIGSAQSVQRQTREGIAGQSQRNGFTSNRNVVHNFRVETHTEGSGEVRQGERLVVDTGLRTGQTSALPIIVNTAASCRGKSARIPAGLDLHIRSLKANLRMPLRETSEDLQEHSQETPPSNNELLNLSTKVNDCIARSSSKTLSENETSNSDNGNETTRSRFDGSTVAQQHEEFPTDLSTKKSTEHSHHDINEKKTSSQIISNSVARVAAIQEVERADDDIQILDSIDGTKKRFVNNYKLKTSSMLDVPRSNTVSFNLTRSSNQDDVMTNRNYDIYERILRYRKGVKNTGTGYNPVESRDSCFNKGIEITERISETTNKASNALNNAEQRISHIEDALVVENTSGQHKHDRDSTESLNIDKQHNHKHVTNKTLQQYVRQGQDMHTDKNNCNANSRTIESPDVNTHNRKRNDGQCVGGSFQSHNGQPFVDDLSKSPILNKSLQCTQRKSPTCNGRNNITNNISCTVTSPSFVNLKGTTSKDAILKQTHGDATRKCNLSNIQEDERVIKKRKTFHSSGLTSLPTTKEHAAHGNTNVLPQRISQLNDDKQSNSGHSKLKDETRNFLPTQTTKNQNSNQNVDNTHEKVSVIKSTSPNTPSPNSNEPLTTSHLNYLNVNEVPNTDFKVLNLQKEESAPHTLSIPPDAKSIPVNATHTLPRTSILNQALQGVVGVAGGSPATPKTHSCDDCGKLFARRQLLLQHRRIHTGVKPYRCEECGKEFTQRGHWSTHLKQHEPRGGEGHACLHCEKTFITRASLKVHLRTHTGVKPYRCPDCDKEFSQLRNFKYHLSVHAGTNEFSTTCPECGKYFNDRGYLSSHMKIHLNRKEYQCQFCDKRFNQRVAYNMHVRIHTGIKPHACTFCTKSFSRKMLLKQHLRIHTGERPFSCDICNKAFADRSNMSLHMRLHSGIKPYTCAVCSKSFTKKHHLKTHMNFHMGVKPYTCTKCGLTFSQSSNMRTHHKRCVVPPGGGAENQTLQGV